MFIFSRDVKKSLEKRYKKGKLRKVTNPQEARSAAQNKELVDTKAADLFSNIVDSYVKKIKTNKILKIVLFSFSLVVLLAFAVAFIVCLFIVVRSKTEIGESLAILIPVGTTAVTSVVSIIVIIAKYLFPQDEDNNFTNLIKVLYEHHNKNDG